MSGKERVLQLQEEMADTGADVMVMRLSENVLLTTGWFVRYSGTAISIVPSQGEAILVVPEHEVEEAAEVFDGDIEAYPALGGGPALEAAVRSAANALNAHGGHVGFEGSFESIAPSSFFGEPSAVAAPTQELIRRAFEAEALVDVTETLERVRAVKTSAELELIQRTNEIAMMGLSAFSRAVVPGATEVEVMAEVERAIMTEGTGHKGAEWVRGFATVWSGPQLAEGWKFFRGGRRAIEPGDAVMIELGTVADGYWSDHTRTVVSGSASKPLNEAYEAVHAALAAALAAAKPGATASDVDRAARLACKEHGFTQHAHHTGHGTGFCYHESAPFIQSGSTDQILANQVIALEPGIYSAELRGGVRHEINAVVGSNGAVEIATTENEFEV